MEQSALSDIDYKSPEYILQNLAFVKDMFADVSHTISARAATFEIISYQVCFYTMCGLRALLGREIAPSILVCGAGELGSKVIERLIDGGCGPFLKIYARGDVDVQKWRKRGLAASVTLSELVLAHNPDILILCVNLSSFPQLNKQLMEYISSYVFVISATFGLQLKRIYHMLKVPGVFRVYTEPSSMYRRIKEINKDPHDAVEQATLSNALQVEDNNEFTSEKLRSKFSNNLDYGASLLARSSMDVRNLILVLENYYGILGMTAAMAREEATDAILGKVIPAVFKESVNGSTPITKPGQGSLPRTPSNKLFLQGSIPSAPSPSPRDGNYGRVTANDDDDDDVHLSESIVVQQSESVSSQNPITKQPSDDNMSQISSEDIVAMADVAADVTSGPSSSLFSENILLPNKNINMLLSTRSVIPSKSKATVLLDSVIKLLKRLVGKRFQKELSKTIRIVDLPPLDPNKSITRSDSFGAGGGRKSSIYSKKARPKGKFSFFEAALAIQNRGKSNPLLDEKELVKIFHHDAGSIDHFLEKATEREKINNKLENEMHTLEYSNFNPISTGLDDVVHRARKYMTRNDTMNVKDDLIEELESWVTMSEQAMLDRLHALEEQKEREAQQAAEEAEYRRLEGLGKGVVEEMSQSDGMGSLGDRSRGEDEGDEGSSDGEDGEDDEDDDDDDGDEDEDDDDDDFRYDDNRKQSVKGEDQQYEYYDTF